MKVAIYIENMPDGTIDVRRHVIDNTKQDQRVNGSMDAAMSGIREYLGRPILRQNHRIEVPDEDLVEVDKILASFEKQEDEE